MNTAFREHSKGNLLAHKQWIESLLKLYYDPMYDYQLRQKEARIIKRGDRASIIKLMGEARFG